MRLVARSFVLRKLVLELGSRAQNEDMGPTTSFVDPPSLGHALALLAQAESRVHPHTHGTADN